MTMIMEMIMIIIILKAKKNNCYKAIYRIKMQICEYFNTAKVKREKTTPELNDRNEKGRPWNLNFICMVRISFEKTCPNSSFK